MKRPKPCPTARVLRGYTRNARTACVRTNAVFYVEAKTFLIVVTKRQDTVAQRCYTHTEALRIFI